MISEWLSKGVSVKSFDPFVKVVVTPFCHPRQKYFGPIENFKDHLKRWFCSINTGLKLMFVEMEPNWGFMGNRGGEIGSIRPRGGVDSFVEIRSGGEGCLVGHPEPSTESLQ